MTRARRAIRAGAQQAKAVHAEATRCPGCSRKRAMVELRARGERLGRICRFCKLEVHEAHSHPNVVRTHDSP